MKSSTRKIFAARIARDEGHTKGKKNTSRVALKDQQRVMPSAKSTEGIREATPTGRTRRSYLCAHTRWMALYLWQMLKSI